MLEKEIITLGNVQEAITDRTIPESKLAFDIPDGGGGWSTPGADEPTQHTMTVDGSWHDLDLTAECGADVKWVMLKIFTQSMVADTLTKTRSVGVYDTNTELNYISNGYTNYKIIQGVTDATIQYWVDAACMQGWIYVIAYQ